MYENGIRCHQTSTINKHFINFNATFLQNVYIKCLIFETITHVLIICLIQITLDMKCSSLANVLIPLRTTMIMPVNHYIDRWTDWLNMPRLCHLSWQRGSTISQSNVVVWQVVNYTRDGVRCLGGVSIPFQLWYTIN